MKAFILAAGLGTRLRPLTNELPKVMLEVGGKKILERTLGQLKAAGVTNAVINTHYFSKLVQNYFHDGSKFGIKIEYSFEPKILGTAGGLKKVEKIFKNEEEFLVVYGDNVFDCDFQPIIETPIKNSCCVVALFDRVKNPNSGAAGGVVEVSVDGYITGFYEGFGRCGTTYVNGGVYKCTPEIFSFIPPNVPYDFGKQVFPNMLKQGRKLQAYMLKTQEALFGVDSLEYLEKAKQYFHNL